MRSSLRLLILLAVISGTVPAQHAKPLSEPPTVSISVLSLFHPQTLILAASEPLTLTLDSHTLNLAPNHPATLACTVHGVSLQLASKPPLTASSLHVSQGLFTLTVPGKLTRLYRGALTVSASSGALSAVVAMPTEVAVASIVQAEAPPHASLEALKAQAVVSRSFLLAHPAAHIEFDACDSTHCQFLRSPPPQRSPASLATHATRGMVITWRSSPDAAPIIVRAMFSQRCGGHTRRSPNSVQSNAYPFYSVQCAFCLRYPKPWHRPLLPPFGSSFTERQRLAFNRIHGWSALPSTSFQSSTLGIEGRGVGHGIGLCQLGAADMAAHGAPYEEIIYHYFPNTSLLTLP